MNFQIDFRVVLCRIRLFPTLISKIKWLETELSLIEFILDLHKPEDYKNKVLDYVKKYATEDALNGNGESKNGDDMDDDSESMSDYDDDTDDGDLNMEM